MNTSVAAAVEVEVGSAVSISVSHSVYRFSPCIAVRIQHKLKDQSVDMDGGSSKGMTAAR